MAFYERFEWLCGEKGVTPSQAAREVGIRQSVVSMWKKRGSTPKGSTLNKLAAYFDVSTDYLLGHVLDASKFGSATGTPQFSGPRNDPAAKAMDCVWPSIVPLTPENLAARAREQSLVMTFRKLNLLGQQKAMERVEELTEIPKYQRQDAPQSPPPPPEGTDTTAGKDTSEGN